MFSVVGMLASVALTYANTSLKASTNAVGPSGDKTYAAGSAVDLAVKYLRDNTSAGVSGGATCGDSTSSATLLTLAANGSSPAVDVKCQPTATSGTVVGGSGGVNDTNPAQAILALGTRNGEPGPYNNDGNVNTVYDSSFAERGIDLQKSSTGGTSTLTFTGNVVSNAPVRRGATAGALAATGTVSARGACENVSPCTVVPYTTAATADPGYPYRTPTLTQQSVPSCPTGTLVKFSPGWYSDASAMNSLFSTCKDKDFWFQPGTYYFDFRNTSGGTQCRPNSTAASDALHEWCIGPYADSKAVVLGGTPSGGWSAPTPVSTTLVAANAADSPSNSWSSLVKAKVIDGSSASESWASWLSTRSVTLSSFGTAIPTSVNSVDSVSLTLATTITQGPINRSVTVTAGDGTDCGTYSVTADSMTIPGLESCLTTPTRVNGVSVRFDAQSQSFGTTKIAMDGAQLAVTYTPPASRFTFPGGCDPNSTGVQFVFGGDSRMYVSDGTLELCAGPNPNGTTTNQQIALYGVPALTPITPSAATAVSGQSWASVSGGSGALDIGEQTGIANATITFTPECGWSSGQIFCFLGSGSGYAYGSVRLDFPPGQFALPANTKLQQVKLRASYRTYTGSDPEFVVHQYQNPSGWSCSAVSDFTTSAGQTSVFTDSISTSCLTAARLASGFSIEWRARDNVSCFFGWCGSQESQTLDGLEVLPDIAPATTSTAVVMPEDGCIVPTPNDYDPWQSLTNRYGMNTYNDVSAPDCALLRWDAVARTTGTASQIGCYSGQVSIQGTVYAPSAAIDFDQAGPKAAGCSAASPTFTSWSYPIFNRGAIVRTLRVRGFRDPTPHAVATCGTASCGGVAQDRVVTLDARVAGSTRVLAKVRYPADGSAPKIERWTVSP